MSVEKRIHYIQGEFRAKNRRGGRDEVVHLRCSLFFCHFACVAPFTLLFVYFTFSHPDNASCYSSLVLKAMWSGGCGGGSAALDSLPLKNSSVWHVGTQQSTRKRRNRGHFCVSGATVMSCYLCLTQIPFLRRAVHDIFPG